MTSRQIRNAAFVVFSIVLLSLGTGVPHVLADGGAAGGGPCVVYVYYDNEYDCEHYFRQDACWDVFHDIVTGECAGHIYYDPDWALAGSCYYEGGLWWSDEEWECDHGTPR
jgi:hypothetical protein